MMYKIYGGRVVTLLIIFLVGFLVLIILRDFIGRDEYFLSLILWVAAMGVLVVRQTFKDFPQGAGAVSERSIQMEATVSQICEAVPSVVKRNHWKLVEAGSGEERFTIKIGMSIWTYGQIMQLSLSKKDDRSTVLRIRCEAPHQLWDHGYNNKVIDRLQHGLDNSLRERKNETHESGHIGVR